jgi:nucleotide-binding universal stress UspA family protein
MFKSILLPIDIAHENSWSKSMPIARKLSEDYGAELHIVTVVQDIRNEMIAQYFANDYEEKMVRDAATKLAAVVAEQLSGVEVKEHVAIGQVYREIVGAAEKNGCDLIVMASHRPELADLLIGPNADHVMRQTPASVMIVRP